MSQEQLKRLAKRLADVMSASIQSPSSYRVQSVSRINLKRVYSVETQPFLQAKPKEFLDASLLSALQDKINQLAATVKSVEFNRQCLLATHSLRTWSHHRSSTRLPTISYFAPSYHRISERRNWASRAFVYDIWSGFFPDEDPRPLRDIQKLQSVRSNAKLYGGYEIAQLAFYHYFSTLIDRVADYWRGVVSAREVFKSFSIDIQLQQRIKTGLKFKPLHKPVHIVPQSIHPIESVAGVGC
jgi:hypothetical protein